MTNNNIPQILITPLKPALIDGVAQKLPVLVRVQAPDAGPAAAAPRKPYHLSLVIDRSGSMSGEPLMQAARCARHIIDRLDPTDVASLVVFDDKVKTLVPAKPVGNRSALHAALAQIRSGGSTELCGGWKAGVASLLDTAPEAALARVILLSDGNANTGETLEPAEIAAFCAQTAEKGVTTSTYGLGRDFNEDLMVEMGRRGGGNHYYGYTAADLFEPFAEEFDFISSLYARQVRLALSASNGVGIRLLNDYVVDEREGFPLIRLPDVPYGAEAWVLLELEIPAALALESGNVLLQAGVTASTPDGLPIAMADATLVSKVLSPQAWDALLADPLVVTRLTELEAGKFLAEARAAAECGDWETIHKMIAEGRKRFADHPWVMEVLDVIAELASEMDTARFRKEAMYSSRRMAARVSAKEELNFDMATEAAAPSFLRRKRAQGKAQFEQRPEEDRK
ncbi:von Willebrand factor type A domain protein [Azoarcus sp. Aa7]|nr:von Willebrand factor type A domain protein [Azoarcus sp. Aa7]